VECEIAEQARAGSGADECSIKRLCISVISNTELTVWRNRSQKAEAFDVFSLVCVVFLANDSLEFC
jgi:hypothetical protein